jgi:hypothetical protein
VRDGFEEGGWIFQENNRNKLGLSLNLKSRKGKEIYNRLVKIADVVACNMTPKGFIGLQVHSNKSPAPLEVRWRNIRIKELP